MVFFHCFLIFYYYYFFYCVGVTLALLSCYDLYFAYFSTPSLKIAVHVDNLLLQTLLDLFLSDLRNFPGRSMTVFVLCYHQLKFKLSNRKSCHCNTIAFKKAAYFLLLEF